MRHTFGTIFLFLWLSHGLYGQIQNVNISGTYSGTFMLSGSASEYEVAGSPYLSETWMYGTLEMKGEIIDKNKDDLKLKAKLYQYNKMIDKINTMIDSLSNPSFKATGLALTMEGIEPESKGKAYDLKISGFDFTGINDITEELEEKLLNHLERLRTEYEAQISDFFKINGLFRYNLYAQEFEMVYNNDTFAITAPFDLKSISISNKKFIHGLYVNRGLTRPRLGSAYFEVLSDGKYKLLRRHNVKIKSGGGPVTYNWAGGVDTFVQYQQLFFQQDEGSEVILLKKSKKALRKLFADRADEVDRFIRAEKINLHDDHDLARVFDFYNNMDS